MTSSLRSVLLIFSIFVLCSWCRTIQWTKAGGTTSWDYGPNWDSQTIPTATDDVIIDLTLIDGDVQIGAVPAFCNSLQIGGTSGRPQRLTVLNALNIGTGGAKILSNGHLILQSSSASPLITAGAFSGGTTFVFESGAIATTGSGSFAFDYLPLNGSALKEISGKVGVTGFLDINPGAGLGVVNINKGQLVVGGTLRTSATVTLSSAVGASLAVTGTFAYSGGSTDVFTVRGDAMITKMTVVSGTVTLNDNVTITSTIISPGAIVNLIGSSTTIRIFGDVTGSGVLQVQGGTNTVSSFTSFGTVQLSGGTLVANTNPSSIASFVQTGGSFTGTSAISISTASLVNGIITKSSITIGNLNVKGFFSLDACTVTLTGVVVIGTTSQLTLSNAVTLTVASTSQISQSTPFKLLPSSPGNSFIHNGKWTTTSDLQILIPTTGTGAFQFANGSTTSITGITFTSGSFTFVGGSFTSISSVVNLNSVFGTGYIESQGQSFTVSGSLSAISYTNTNGLTTIGVGSITNLNVASGTFNITGASATSSTIQFKGGVITGAGSTVLSASNVVVTTNQFKSIQDIVLKTTSLTLQCGADPCQLATTDATITANTQLGIVHTFEKKRSEV